MTNNIALLVEFNRTIDVGYDTGDDITSQLNNFHDIGNGVDNEIKQSTAYNQLKTELINLFNTNDIDHISWTRNDSFKINAAPIVEEIDNIVDHAIAMMEYEYKSHMGNVYSVNSIDYNDGKLDINSSLVF